MTCDDGANKSIDELFQLGTTYCTFHKAVETTTRATHMLCIECGHAWQTENELINAYNAKVVDVSRESCTPHWNASLLAKKSLDVVCCPLCDHNF